MALFKVPYGISECKDSGTPNLCELFDSLEFVKINGSDAEMATSYGDHCISISDLSDGNYMLMLINYVNNDEPNDFKRTYSALGYLSINGTSYDSEVLINNHTYNPNGATFAIETENDLTLLVYNIADGAYLDNKPEGIFMMAFKINNAKYTKEVIKELFFKDNTCMIGNIYDEYHLFDVYRKPTKANIYEAISNKKDKQLLVYFVALNMSTTESVCGLGMTSYSGLLTGNYKSIGVTSNPNNIGYKDNILVHYTLDESNTPQPLAIISVEYMEMIK